MRFDVIKPNELTDQHRQEWKDLLRSDPVFGSPFFHPGFAECLSEFRSDIEIALVFQENDLVGVFPFHRHARGIAHPLGLRLSDMQGAVFKEGVEWDGRALLRGCRLRTFRFDHMVGPQRGFTPYAAATAASPFLDLSNGMEAYEAARRESGSSVIQQLHRKRRKLDREKGPLRFDFLTADESHFESLLGWKSEQRSKTQTFNVLELEWVQAFLRRLLTWSHDGFRGVQSTLFVGDELVAVHLGVCTDEVMHYWFPTYNPEYSRYSPGLILTYEIASQAAQCGVKRLDLGKGDDRHKNSLASAAVPVWEGSVCTDPVRQSIGGSLQWMRRKAKSTPALQGLKQRLTWLRRRRAAAYMR